MMRTKLTIPAVLLGLTMAAYGQYSDLIPAGTTIPVRTDQRIELRNARANGRVYTARVSEDVRDASGNVAIPRGASAELVVRSTGSNESTLDLDSVTVNGRRYVVAATAKENAGKKEGVGANSRTGKYVGGGAILGTIIGAIAGGGKGAAIGAISGAAAGAGAQVLTRGKDIKVPAETVLKFKLDQPLELGRGANARDRGYTKNGQHYHRY